MRLLLRISWSILLGVLLLLLGQMPIGHWLTSASGNFKAPSNVINVAPAPVGSDTPTCGSGTPCRTIKYAVESRASAGDQIQVANGQYTDTVNITIAGLKIYGADPVSTVIDGQANRGPMVTFEAGLTNSTVFSGFTVRNGLAVTNAGGLLLNGSHPTLQFVIIHSNTAQAGSGGGIYMIDSSPRITAATIQHNTAISGGGIYAAGNSAPIFRANTICGNTPNQFHNAGVVHIDASSNWWGTNSPQVNIDYSGSVSATPAIDAQLGIVGSGTANLPLAADKPHTLQLTMQQGQYAPPPNTMMTLSANDVIFYNSTDTIILSVLNGVASTTITPTVAGSLVISATHGCQPTEPVASIARNVIKAGSSVYLPILLKD
jgi:hypothetical protein